MAQGPAAAFDSQQDLVRRVAWVAAATDEREDVAPEEHLDDADAAVGKVCQAKGS